MSSLAFCLVVFVFFKNVQVEALLRAALQRSWVPPYGARGRHPAFHDALSVDEAEAAGGCRWIQNKAVVCLPSPLRKPRPIIWKTESRIRRSRQDDAADVPVHAVSGNRRCRRSRPRPLEFRFGDLAARLDRIRVGVKYIPPSRCLR